MKRQALNPFLPSWEYVPDGEPHVFDGRVYLYGSHDLFNGHVFCLGDYVCWSAPADDLSDWRYEGVIYEKTADPLNRDGKMCLYAPDVTRGPDGRYYLYYVLDHVSVVSVAVCDAPAGMYRYYGCVHHPDGTPLGEKPGDEPQFDPGVIFEDGRTYLYTGFCGRGDKSRSGAMATVLADDMLTVLEPPRIIVPGCEYAAGTPYEGHAFFEAPSIRKYDGKWYFVYSSQAMHELCWAVSDSPTKGFSYGGVLVSSRDMRAANNHGGLLKLGDKYYIFYHRHTNGTWYSRQACAEELVRTADGGFLQAEPTSCGLNGGPLLGAGRYPAHMACVLTAGKPFPGQHSGLFRITQDGRDGDEEPGYVSGFTDGATAGYKYFRFRGLTGITLTVRGYGSGGALEVKTSPHGPALAAVKLSNTNVWEDYTLPLSIPNGVSALYLTYRGAGSVSLLSLELRI